MSHSNLIDLFSKIQNAQDLAARPAQGKDGQPATFVRSAKAMRDLANLVDEIVHGIETFLPVGAARRPARQAQAAAYMLNQVTGEFVHAAPKDIVDVLGALKVLESQLAEAYPIAAAEFVSTIFIKYQAAAKEQIRQWPAFELESPTTGPQFTRIAKDRAGLSVRVTVAGEGGDSRGIDSLDVAQTHEVLRIIRENLPVPPKMPEVLKDTRHPYSLRADTTLTRENLTRLVQEFIAAHKVPPRRIRIDTSESARLFRVAPGELSTLASRLKGFFAPECPELVIEFHNDSGANVAEVSS